MNILALDTSTECCSAALWYQGQLFEQSQHTQRGHSQLILGMLDQLFNRAGTDISSVEALAFGCGPGSFTGVRVGVSVAQGIAFARNIPVIPVSTLAAVAQAAIEHYDCEQVAVAIDARMGEVYCCSYVNQAGHALACSAEQVAAPETFMPAGAGNWLAAGSGWAAYPQQLGSNFSGQLLATDAQLLPQASIMLKLAQREAAQGNLLPAEQALPVYLRNNVAKKKGEQ